MEGAQAEQIGAGAFQVHILAYHIFNWISGNQLVQKGLRKCHDFPSFPIMFRLFLIPGHASPWG